MRKGHHTSPRSTMPNEMNIKIKDLISIFYIFYFCFGESTIFNSHNCNVYKSAHPFHSTMKANPDTSYPAIIIELHTKYIQAKLSGKRTGRSCRSCRSHTDIVIVVAVGGCAFWFDDTSNQ